MNLWYIALDIGNGTELYCPIVFGNRKLAEIYAKRTYKPNIEQYGWVVKIRKVPKLPCGGWDWTRIQHNGPYPTA